MAIGVGLRIGYEREYGQSIGVEIQAMLYLRFRSS